MLAKIGLIAVCTCAAVVEPSASTTRSYAIDYSTDDTVSWDTTLVWGEENGQDFAEGTVFLAYLGGTSYFGATATGDVMFRVPYDAVSEEEVAVIEQAYDDGSTIQVTWDTSGNFNSFTIQ